MKRLYLLFFVLTVASLGFAQTKYWVGNYSNKWEDSQNWNPQGTPTANDDVVIPSTGTYQPYVDSNATCKNLTAASSSSVIIRQDRSLTVTGNFSTHGSVALLLRAKLEVKGDATWNSNSAINTDLTTQCVFHKNLTLN